MSTLKQRKAIVSRAIKNLDKAADSLAELNSLAFEFGVESDREERFISDFKERAAYWEKCTWWKKGDY